MDSILNKVRECLEHLNETGSVHEDTEKVFQEYNRLLAHQELETVHKILHTNLDFQSLSNMIHSVKQHCVGDGCGLKSGTYIDDVISEYFSQNLVSYQPFFSKEADMKICNIPLSLKSCTSTKGTQFALNWSKNKEVDTNNFIYHVMILVSCSGNWWKNKPVKAGIYLIDKNWCKANVQLGANKKTDKLISKNEVYKMLENASFFTEIPEPNKTIKFNILKAFSDQASEIEHTSESSQHSQHSQPV